MLSGIGAEVLGPVATAAEARALIDADVAMDGMLLDVNLRGELAFDIADALQSRGIAFATGYDHAALPSRFSGMARILKPVDPNELARTCATLAGSPAGRAG